MAQNIVVIQIVRGDNNVYELSSLWWYIPSVYRKLLFLQLKYVLLIPINYGGI